VICQSCRTAGTFNRVALDETLDQARDGFFNYARKFHLDCRGGTWCDCQHKLGEAIQAAYRDESCQD
jgi:hypothetical protein